MEIKNIIFNIEDNIGIITMNRPEVLNALNIETINELDSIISNIEQNQEVKVVIITGSGKSFVAGADIKEMKDLNPIEALKFAKKGQSVFKRIENLQCPVIAAINGFALGGGCELAMSCDIRLASNKAKLGQPEVNLGVIPGFGGTQRLTRLVGIGKAKELLYTGNMINAEEALNIGLVNAIYESEILLEKAKEMAKKILQKSPFAISMCKTCINNGLEQDLDKSIEMEAELFALTFSSEDQKEGMKAFIEKRNPNFTGK